MKSSMIKDEMKFLIDCSIETLIEMKFSILIYAGVIVSSILIK